MLSIYSLGFLAIAGLSAAQQDQYWIDPEDVAESDRRAWCVNQKAQCPLICLQQPGVTSQTTIENECDWEVLTFSCVCENNSRPNLTEWSQTVPYYICTEWGNRCVKDCGGVTTCETACREDHPCGAQNPYTGNGTKPVSTTATTAPSSQETGENGEFVPGWGDAGDSGDDKKQQNQQDKPNAAAMLNIGQTYGLAVVLGGIVAGFAVML